MTVSDAKADLPERLREIAEMDRTQCRKAWGDAFGSEPPKYMSVPFMRRLLAQDCQCRTLGGYSVATKRALKRVLGDKDVSGVTQTVGVGNTLVREWNGRVYRIEVMEEGYVLDGRTFASLSAVARHITGAKWSGPRFFGLTRKQGA